MKIRKMWAVTVICIAAVCLSIVICTQLWGNAASQNSSPPDSTIYLKAYNNTVALYRGDSVIETYDDIVLDSLPIKDQNTLIDGIIINNDEQLNRLIEDFDG